ncbi:MAG: hypothetical protein K940chlam7_01690, partial [Chlamydiae bacterium]|nr:hypothetical protein [Chlamydiota bacterium]
MTNMENHCLAAEGSSSKWRLLLQRFFSKISNNKDQRTDQIAQRALGSLALGAVGDTLGFGSGHNPQHSGLISPWELRGDTAYIFTVLSERFQGNYRNIRFRNSTGKQEWVISDDTILHFMQAQTIVNLLKTTKTPTPQQTVNAIAEAHVKTLREYDVELTNKRWFGNSTRKTCRLIENDPTHWNKYISYNPDATGCGGSMRGMIFGWLYPGERNCQELIATSLNAGFLTNPSLTGALGTLSSAALTAFSLDDVPVSEWISKLQDVFLKTKGYLEAMPDAGEDCPQQYKELVKGCLEENEWKRVFDNWTFFFTKTTGGKDRIPEMTEFPKDAEQRDRFHSEIEKHVYGGQNPKPNRLTIGDRGDTSV